MRVGVFSTKSYDEVFLTKGNDAHGHELLFFEPRLTEKTYALAAGLPAVCVFVNDELNRSVLTQLAQGGTRLIVLRSAGFNNVDLIAADELGLTVARVPAYSPHAVAEHTVGLILTLNRKIHRSYARVRDGNFALDGLLGFDLHGRTVGIIGTGQIGSVAAQILNGFGCVLIGYDLFHNPQCEAIGLKYVSLEELLTVSDIITLHCPLTPATRYLINDEAVKKMKERVMLINTGRGALVDTQAVVRGLKSGKIGYVGLDVYEEESELFFEDLSDQVIQDDIFMRLVTFPNVVITAHQGFFTTEAMENIAETTLSNITSFEKGEGVIHKVTKSKL